MIAVTLQKSNAAEMSEDKDSCKKQVLASVRRLIFCSLQIDIFSASTFSIGYLRKKEGIKIFFTLHLHTSLFYHYMTEYEC